MDMITASLLKEFSAEFEIESLPEDERFEHFTSYVAVRQHYSEPFEPSDIICGAGGDLGIDATAAIVNGILVTEVEEFQELLLGNPDYLDVTFIFLQAERSASFDASKLGNFGYGVCEFFNPKTLEPTNDSIKTAIKLMTEIYSKSGKFKRANPVCRLYYATTGKWSGEGALEARRQKVKAELESLEYFSEVEVFPIGAMDLQKYYNQTKNSISREFIFADRQDVPEIPGVQEAFVGFVPAKQFLPIISEGGELVRSIFYDNVRDFQGYNDVNDAIRLTLKSDRKKRFVLMNNGVTIIARNVTHTGSRFVIEDFQIVNGCQTSHVLFDNKDELDDTIMVPLKLISTQDEDVIQDIIRATNKQTEINSEQFFAISDFARQLEMHFQSFPDNKKLFYERRSRQYDRLNIEKTRIVVQTSTVRAFAAMFLEEPQNTVRRYKTLSDKIGKEMFVAGHKLLPYYTASYSLYLLEYLFRNQKIDSRYKIVRFQILLALRLLANPDAVAQLNSKHVETYCDKICAVLWDNNKMEKVFEKAIKAVDSVAGETLDRDQLHTITFTDALIKHCKGIAKK